MKLIAGALITAVLLAGCSSESAGSSSSVDAPSSVDILQIKQEACSMFREIGDISEPDNFSEAGIKTTGLFDKLAKFDPQYKQIAEYVALISITDFSDQTSNGLALIAVRKVQYFCS
jgi:hypothetical protein